MPTIVSIMDRAGFEANTDIMVVVSARDRQLLWVPRDLYCTETLSDRINIAYKKGGPNLLLRALSEHGLEVTASLCLSRDASEAALEPVSVLVPVPARMVFSYPLAPTERIEDGAKQIEFNPPAELLKGERIHQWLGARGSSDLHRIERQKVFVRRLLEQRFDFASFLHNPDWYQLSDPHALHELAQVRPDWNFDTFADLTDQIIEGKVVFVTRKQYPIYDPVYPLSNVERRNRLQVLIGQMSVADNLHSQPRREHDSSALGTSSNIFVADMVNNFYGEEGTVCQKKYHDKTSHTMAQLRYSGLLLDGYALPPVSPKGQKMSTRDSINWLNGKLTNSGPSAADRGWSMVGKKEAVTIANEGHPVVVGLVDERDSHMAVLRPGCDVDDDIAELHVAQAGGIVAQALSLQEGFNTTDVSFFAYRPVDYTPLKEAVHRYILNNEPQILGVNIGYAFVDIRTGQSVNANGCMPQTALSIFKPQLAACYLWLAENEYIEERPEHDIPLSRMLSRSAASNEATTCVFQFVGGLAVFNDWLVDQGFTLSSNFVSHWLYPSCDEAGPSLSLEVDDRYMTGERRIKLPPNSKLTGSYSTGSVDNLVMPVEMAHFYGRIYREQLLSPANTRRWLSWMQRTRDDSLLHDALPQSEAFTVYAKHGWLAADQELNRNIHHEVGIIQSASGAFALGIYVRDYPEFPANAVIHNLASITYAVFESIHC